jgi:putative redox protein
MAEKVIVRMKNGLKAEVWAPDPRDPESDEIRLAGSLNELTPYGMLMASLGICTAQLLHSYAGHHGLQLDDVEFVIQYRRVFRKDIEHYDLITKFSEHIEQEIILNGKLTPGERDRLFMIADRCPVNRMLGQGIEVQSTLIRELE